MPEQSPLAPAKFVPALTGIRALAALLVLGLHADQNVPAGITAVLPFLARGYPLAAHAAARLGRYHEARLERAFVVDQRGVVRLSLVPAARSRTAAGARAPCCPANCNRSACRHRARFLARGLELQLMGRR